MHRPAPKFDEKIYPAHKVAALLQTLAEEGVAPSEVLAGTGLTPERLRSANTRVSYRQVQAAFLNAIRLTRDPASALHAGLRMRVTSYGMYGYALLSSQSHEDSRSFALKYHRVMGPVGDMECTEEEGDVVFLHVPLLSLDPDDDLYRYTLEFQLASHLTINRDLYGAGFRLSGLKLAYAAPEHAHQYQEVFGCPVHFGQARNEFRFDRRWMAEPMLYADPITNAMAREMCEKSLAELGKPGDMAAQVYRALIEQPGWFPNIDAMAQALHLHTRTLRRRLVAEGASYRDILAEVRMRLAIEYLQKTNMTNDEIATRLGYSEAANFRHAFARWTGCSPSDYRTR